MNLTDISFLSPLPPKYRNLNIGFIASVYFISFLPKQAFDAIEASRLPFILRS